MKKSRNLCAKDLIKLATRIDPKTPIVLLASDGAEIALAGGATGIGEAEIDGEVREVIIISSMEGE